MKLLTKALLKKFSSVWSQQEEENPLMICKFFCASFHWTRYASEYIAEDGLFFWYVIWDFPERWYFSLTELQEFRGKLWLWMERDLHFDPCRYLELPEIKNS